MVIEYILFFCETGEKRSYLANYEHLYRLPDGNTVPINVNPVWCPNCNDFTDVEVIESLESIDAEISKLEDEKSEEAKRLKTSESDMISMLQEAGITPVKTISYLEQQRQKARLRKQWRNLRKSPPRCLSCSGFEIIPLPFNEEFVGPAAFGRMRIDHSPVLINARVRAYLYSVDGERLAPENKFEA